MASRMRLFLIRHGETIDNVAQRYAGSIDSELTNHGFHQATRLGLHFASLDIRFTHIFSSHLQRAAKTAGLIQQAQATASAGADISTGVPNVVQLPVLMEQDFGSYEGKKWSETSVGTGSNDKEHRYELYKEEVGFKNVESKESLAQRADTFLEDHLLPLLEHPNENEPKNVVAIVSHGILLSMLWKRFLLRLPQKSVSFSPEVTAASGALSLEHLGGWSNTGYLELLMTRAETQIPAAMQVTVSSPISGTMASDNTANVTNVQSKAPVPPLISEPSATTTGSYGRAYPSSHVPIKLADCWTISVRTVNGRDHLKGIKRTGGGVGSARHDTSQKNIDSFFKRRKV